MTILPSEKTVVLEPIPNETESGFYVPPSDEKKQPEKGRVAFIGKGEQPLEIKIGDILFYERWADFKIPVTAEKEYIFVRFDKVLGKLLPENEKK